MAGRSAVNRASRRIRTLPSATKKVSASNLAWIVTLLRPEPPPDVMIDVLEHRVIDLRDHQRTPVKL